MPLGLIRVNSWEGNNAVAPMVPQGIRSGFTIFAGRFGGDIPGGGSERPPRPVTSSQFAMRPVATFTIVNALPEPIRRLGELCRNLYWTWNPTISALLRSIDPELWHRTNHHPLRILQQVGQEHLERLAEDPEFLNRYQEAIAILDHYLSGRGWYGVKRPEGTETIAYFSAEFGIHESVPLYSGGLGVLSGDHTKSASDLGLPLVCMGLMYQMGYFRQRIGLDGTQLESYDFNDPSLLPAVEMLDGDRKPIRIALDYPLGTVYARVWRMDVGRVPIYLLDTNIPENTVPAYRDIADYLYGGDQETRIMQEIMLGIGGMRALRSIGINPTITHSNEGHSAFLMLERARLLMEELGLTFVEASELAAAGSVFTTHTPVPAGNDVFPVEMMDKYFRNYWPKLGLSREEFLSLGRINGADQNEAFSMTVLALKLASRRNGVSQLHGHVSRDMWKQIWPGLPTSEIPIAGITNGVHTQTWVADAMGRLFDEHLAENWRDRITDPELWKKASAIPNGELWQAKTQLRHEMVDYIHRRLEDQQAEWYARSLSGRHAEGILDPNVLTIGFARRFATYKRATLLFRDRERAIRLFNDPDRPIQLVVAGKAHPKDLPGKRFIKEVVEFIRETGLEGRIVFIEDYDMAVARRMTQGCDIWLNTPRRPLEASGTSGMKAAINGTLNLSVLDGWYPEGYDGDNGFAIGAGEEFNDPDLQDEFESRQLYRVLEERVLPLFYAKDENGLPREWIEMQKHGLVTLAGAFSADRMVTEYAERFYFPSADRFARLRRDHGDGVRSLIAWQRNVAQNWAAVTIGDVQIDAPEEIEVGGTIAVSARVTLGSLSPADIQVEAYCGGIDEAGLIAEGTAFPLDVVSVGGGGAVYRGTIAAGHAGRVGVTVRAFPRHPDLAGKLTSGIIRWA